MTRVVIVDYGMGNLYSVARAFEALHCHVTVSGDPAALASADRLVLPGVGAFGEGMRNLAARGLVDALGAQVLTRGTPLLGICLGMQLLAREGFEPVVLRSAGDDGDSTGRDAEIVLESCPFAAAAETDPTTVCALHLGIAQGVADLTGGRIVVDDLVANHPRRAQCRLHVHVEP